MGEMLRMNEQTSEEPKWWIFTFGSGQKHAGKCVRIKGTFSEARATMFERYGVNWAFQYSEEQWKKIEEDPMRFWQMEEVLEVIE